MTAAAVEALFRWWRGGKASSGEQPGSRGWSTRPDPFPGKRGLLGTAVAHQSHRWMFMAEDTAGEAYFKGQALSGDIPGVNPGCREGVSPALEVTTFVISCGYREFPCADTRGGGW